MRGFWEGFFKNQVTRSGGVQAGSGEVQVGVQLRTQGVGFRCGFRWWVLGQVGKNPGLKKNQPSGFFCLGFWVFLVLFVFFCFFLYIYPEERVFRFFFV
jgi:hypothetical protein